METQDNGKFAPVIWIKVNVSDGMFSSERAVTIELMDGKTISLFADLSILKQKGVDWFLQVTIMEERINNVQKVLLPTEAFETSSRWLDVSDENILATT